MRRRTFLAAVGASAAVAWWPRLIRHAFADASFDVPGAKKTAPGLASARTRAQQANKPLFVIVVPADDGQKYGRGELWGEYLNHGGAADLAPLAQVEVSCATMKELSSLAPDVRGEPLAVVVEPDGRARALDATYPAHGTRMLTDDDEEAVSGRRIRALATMVRRALSPIAPADVRPAADQVIRRLRNQPPAGSHWANASACGYASVEGMKDDDDERVHMACGMGHIPSKSSRFLYFFAKTPTQMAKEEWSAAQKRKPKP